MHKVLVAAAVIIGLPPTAAGQDLSARLDSVISEAAANGFSGVVRVEKDDKVILEKGYGFANRELRIPFSPSTVVQIGSNTKDFTIISLLQLQKKGRLSLADPISKYFPQAPADKRLITLSQLVDHEAGFPLGIGGDFEPVTRDQLVENAMRMPLLFTPGARKNYSNTGYSLLAAVIEKVSGKSYDEYVRETILTPSGLNDTGFHLPRFNPERLAHGYRSNGENNGTMLSRPHAPDGPHWNLRGNGGLLSTVGDMSRFYDALFDTDKILPRDERAGRFNPREPVALAGSDRVSSFLYERDPAMRLEIIVATNTADWRPGQIVDRIMPLLMPPGTRGQRVIETSSPQDHVPGKPPARAVAAIITELIDTINRGDKEALRAFIAERFDTSPGTPTVEARLERMAPMHDNLGDIEIRGMTDVEGGSVRVLLKTAREGPATMTVDIDGSAPHRIRKFGLLVGGD